MNFEKLIKQIYTKYKVTQKRTQHEECVSDEDIVLFLDGVLPDSRIFVEHLTVCRQCADRVKENYDMLQSVDNMPCLVPEELIERVKSFVPQKKRSHMDIVLKLKEDLFELVKTSGELLDFHLGGAQPAMIYRTSDEDKQNVVCVRQSFDSLGVCVAIEKTDVKMNVLVNVLENKSPKNGVRVSLAKKGRELESLLTQKGSVHFKGFDIENYQLELIDESSKIGVIDIHIM